MRRFPSLAVSVTSVESSAPPAIAGIGGRLSGVKHIR
jgi:hypothetical protein